MRQPDRLPADPDAVVDDPRPINANLWGQWVRAGNDRWDVVRRSWTVFARNTTELIELLKIPALRSSKKFGSRFSSATWSSRFIVDWTVVPVAPT